MDADKIIVENIEVPDQGISSTSIDQNDQQCIRQKIGKRKRIYSLTNSNQRKEKNRNIN